MAVDHAMGQVLWTRHFLSAQGIAVPTTTIYQDNNSTIILAENGSTSSSKRTKHLDVCYYFVTDKIKKGKVEHCSTRDMFADFFTKPLQGSIFPRMQEKILNLPGSTSTAAHRSVLRSEKNKVNNDEQKYIRSGTGTLSGGDISAGHKVSWANGTKRDAGEPRNEKVLGSMHSASGSLSGSSA